MPSQPLAPGRIPLSGCYFLHFAAVGITQPVLPAYLEPLDVPATQAGLLLSRSPLSSLLAPPLCGRSRRCTG